MQKFNYLINIILKLKEAKIVNPIKKNLNNIYIYNE